MPPPRPQHCPCLGSQYVEYNCQAPLYPGTHTHGHPSGDPRTHRHRNPVSIPPHCPERFRVSHIRMEPVHCSPSWVTHVRITSARLPPGLQATMSLYEVPWRTSDFQGLHDHVNRERFLVRHLPGSCQYLGSRLRWTSTPVGQVHAAGCPCSDLRQAQPQNWSTPQGYSRR